MGSISSPPSIWANKHIAVSNQQTHRRDTVPVLILHFRRTASCPLFPLGTQLPCWEETQAGRDRPRRKRRADLPVHGQHHFASHVMKPLEVDLPTPVIDTSPPPPRALPQIAKSCTNKISLSLSIWGQFVTQPQTVQKKQKQKNASKNLKQFLKYLYVKRERKRQGVHSFKHL